MAKFWKEAAKGFNNTFGDSYNNTLTRADRRRRLEQEQAEKLKRAETASKYNTWLETDESGMFKNEPTIDDTIDLQEAGIFDNLISDRNTITKQFAKQNEELVKEKRKLDLQDNILGYIENNALQSGYLPPEKVQELTKSFGFDGLMMYEDYRQQLPPRRDLGSQYVKQGEKVYKVTQYSDGTTTRDETLYDIDENGEIVTTNKKPNKSMLENFDKKINTLKLKYLDKLVGYEKVGQTGEAYYYTLSEQIQTEQEQAGREIFDALGLDYDAITSQLIPVQEAIAIDSSDDNYTDKVMKKKEIADANLNSLMELYKSGDIEISDKELTALGRWYELNYFTKPNFNNAR